VLRNESEQEDADGNVTTDADSARQAWEAMYA